MITLRGGLFVKNPSLAVCSAAPAHNRHLTVPQQLPQTNMKYVGADVWILFRKICGCEWTTGECDIEALPSHIQGIGCAAANGPFPLISFGVKPSVNSRRCQCSKRSAPLVYAIGEGRIASLKMRRVADTADAPLRLDFFGQRCE
jgi:hypothetical protein